MKTRDPLRVDPIYYVNIDNMNKSSFMEAWMDHAWMAEATNLFME